MAGDREIPEFEPELELNRSELDPDPLTQFKSWFDQASEVAPMPDAMALATVDRLGNPDVRMVLFKGLDDSGFRFFTNYTGTKAGQLGEVPRAALVFHWVELNREVRVRGEVERLTEAESDEYFASRSRSSQIGAWASPQSSPLGDDRSSLDELLAVAESKFDGVEEVPRPPHWGGYRLIPAEIEFWQGRESRLHDRFLYQRKIGGEAVAAWSVTRLAP